MNTYRTSVFAELSIILLPALLLFTGCGRSPSRHPDPISDTGFYLDTVVTITLYGVADDSLIQDCFSLMADYEALLSRTRPGSDVWKINHSQGEPVQVSPDTADLIRRSLYYSGLSDGAFDVTIAPVTDLWDFTGEGQPSLPDPAQLSEALAHVDYRNILLEDTSVTLSDPQSAIDLGGIAKGYIADRLKEFLLTNGRESGLIGGIIDLGGNILTVGSKPDGSSWRIGVRRPFAQTAAELAATVTCSDLSLVTSGTYERYFELDGTLYHHILDPQTGYPADTDLSSVSILASSSMDCDALSTSCFLLGLDQGMALIETLADTEALFITENGELYRSSGFPQE